MVMQQAAYLANQVHQKVTNLAGTADKSPHSGPPAKPEIDSQSRRVAAEGQ
jgi:hypothetical protein